MLSTLQAHPEYVIFTVVFSVMFIYGIRKNLVYSMKVSSLFSKLALIPSELTNGYADVHVSTITDQKKVNYGRMSIIADEHTKGYDLILIEQPEVGSVVPMHKHKKANELFYMLEGAIRVYACDKGIKVKNCFEGCKKATELKNDDWLFVKANRDHCVEVLEPAKYLIIAKPPLFSRIGKLYEFLFKKK